LLKTAVKKVISFILLVCLFFNLSGYHLFFYLRKQELKADMKEILRSSLMNKDIQQFILPLNNKGLVADIEWEGKEEFRMNGEMYDVVEKRIEDGKMIIRCISDTKETSLIKDYEKTCKDDFSNFPSRHKSALLLKLVSSLYVSPSVNDPFFCNIPLVKYMPICYRIILPIPPDILIPPPKVA
jgi:hypothetical protein